MIGRIDVNADLRVPTSADLEEEFRMADLRDGVSRWAVRNEQLRQQAQKLADERERRRRRRNAWILALACAAATCALTLAVMSLLDQL